MGKPTEIPQGMEWVSAYVDEVAFERNYAKRTAQKARSALIKWLNHIGPSYEDFCTATAEDAAEWAEKRCTQASPTTVHHEISHLRTLYIKALADGDALSNPFYNLDVERDSHSKLAEAVTPAELRRVLTTAKERCPQSVTAKLDYAVLCLKLRCGATPAELSRAVVGDYASDGSTGFLRLNMTCGDQYVTFVDAESAKALQSYLATRLNLADTSPLFVKTRKSRDCRQTEAAIDRRIWSCFERAGVKVGNRSVKRGMYELAKERGASDAELATISRNLSPALVAQLAVEDQQTQFVEAWDRLSSGADSRRPVATASLSRTQIATALGSRANRFELCVDADGIATISPVANKGRVIDHKRAEMAHRREELGLTQSQAAKAVGIAHGTWNKIETGACDLSEEVAPRVEELLGMDFTYGVEEVDLSGVDEATYLKCMTLVDLARQIAAECRGRA